MILTKFLPLPEFTSFKFSNYRFWWVSSGAVMLTMFTTQMAMSWWVLSRTDSPQWVGVTIFSFGLPALLFTIPAGALADKVDKRKMLMGAQFGALTLSLTFALLALFESANLAVAIGFAFGLGTSNAFSQPPRQALIPLLLPRNLLMNGVVLGNFSQTSSQLAGPAIAGLLMAAAGAEAAFLFLAGLQFVGLISLTFMKVPTPPSTENEEISGNLTPDKTPSVFRNLMGGLIFVWQNKPFLVLLILYTAVGFWVGGAISALVPILIRDVFERGPSALGFAFSLQAGTGLITGLYLTKLGGMKNKGGFFAMSVMLGSASLASYSMAPSYPIALIFFGTFGIASSFYVNMSQTLVQVHTPQHLMGRVLSIFAVFSQGFTPMGALQAGIVAGLIGVRFSAVYGALICLTMATLALLFAHNFRKLQ